MVDDKYLRILIKYSSQVPEFLLYEKKEIIYNFLFAGVAVLMLVLFESLVSPL